MIHRNVAVDNRTGKTEKEAPYRPVEQGCRKGEIKSSHFRGHWAKRFPTREKNHRRVAHHQLLTRLIPQKLQSEDIDDFLSGNQLPGSANASSPKANLIGAHAPFRVCCCGARFKGFHHACNKAEPKRPTAHKNFLLILEKISLISTPIILR